MLHKAREWKLLREVPRFKLFREVGRALLLDDEAERKLLPVARQPLCDVIVLMRDTGMRKERELYRMRIENMDWDNRVIFNPDSKTAEAVHPETFERLFRVPAQNEPPSGTPPVAELQSVEAARRKELLDQAEQQNAEWLDVESENLDHYAEDLERAFETEIKAAESKIREAKKAMRGSTMSMADKVAEKRRISALEGKRDKMKSEFFDRRAKIRTDAEAMLDQIQESLKLDPSLTVLFTIRWEVL
jgi:hypothetical protein